VGSVVGNVAALVFTEDVPHVILADTDGKVPGMTEPADQKVLFDGWFNSNEKGDANINEVRG